MHGVDDFTMEQKLPPRTTEILNLYLQGHSPARIGHIVRLEEGRVLFTFYQFGAVRRRTARCGPNSSGMRVRLPPKRLRQGLQRRLHGACRHRRTLSKVIEPARQDGQGERIDQSEGDST